MTFSETAFTVLAMDNDTLPPWDCIDPALTPERLAIIAAIIREETDAKINVRDWRDMNWNIGCDCHAWVLSRMHRESKAECKDWLFIESVEGDLDLSFRIGGKDGVQAKIYKPNSPGQPQRTLRCVHEELRAIQEALGKALAPAPDPALRFAFDKDDAGRVTAVRLVQLSLEGTPVYVWPIWSADTAVVPIDNIPMPEGVELEEPNVTLPEDEEAAEADKKKKNDTKGGA